MNIINKGFSQTFITLLNKHKLIGGENYMNRVN